MNENAKKWVEALRSGEFKQATGHLRTQSGHCCMGVLCELFMREGGSLHVENCGGISGATFFDNDATLLPKKVQRWAGLKDWKGRFLTNTPDNGDVKTADCLTAINDRGATFAEIADLIESEPPGLFV